MKTIHLIAQLSARTGQEESLREALITLARATREEPGCLLFRPYACDEKGCFLVEEHYESQEAFEQHLASDHFQAVAVRLPLLAGCDVESHVLEDLVI